MARRLFIFPVLLIFATTAAAQTLDKEKLRKAAYLPYITVSFGWKASGVDECGKTMIPANRIRSLTQRLQGVPEDARLYLDMAELHGELKQEQERIDALEKAEKSLKPILDTQNPKHGILLCAYARYLE